MDCASAKIKLTIHERTTFDRSYQLKDSAGEIIPLTGYSAVMTIMAKLTDESPIVSILETTTTWAEDGPSGIYMDEADDGKYRIYLRDDDLSDICAAHKDIDGVYDLFLTAPTGETVFKQYGQCIIKAAVSR